MNGPETYADYQAELNQEMNLLERAVDGLSGNNEHLDLIAKILLLQNKMIREGLNPLPALGPNTISTPYKIATLPLDTALENREIQIPGSYFTYTVDVNPGNIYVRVDNEGNEAIPLSKFNYITIPFRRLFVTSPAYSGKTLTIFIGDKATRASGMGRVDSDGSPIIASISPAEEFTTGSKDVTAAGTAEALAASTPCREVIITAKAANAGYVYIGDSSVSSTQFAKQLLASDEFILSIDDLSKVYLDVDNAGEGVVYGYLN